MKVAIGSDHNGYDAKRGIVEHLVEKGIEVTDKGPRSRDRVLVDGFAVSVGEAVSRGEFDTGILVCGTGQGMAIFANRIIGVRAAVCHDIFTARMARENNDANVLCLGSDVTGPGHILAIVDEWLSASYKGYEDDTLRRLEQLEGGLNPVDYYRDQSGLVERSDHVDRR